MTSNNPKVKLKKGPHCVTATVDFNGRTVQRCGHSFEEAFEKARRAWNETCDYLFFGDFKIPQDMNHPWFEIMYGGV